MQKTIINLSKAFAGESQARNRYDMYAKIAKKEGYEQISAIFTETAIQEQEHAKQFFRTINQLREDNSLTDEIKIEADIPVVLKDTLENLKTAIQGEAEEHESMYPEFARIAREEGLEEIALKLEAIGKAEEHHKERYQKLLNELESQTIFKKDKEINWICRKCGYAHTGNTPTETCPSCNHPTAYFQVQCENY